MRVTQQWCQARPNRAASLAAIIAVGLALSGCSTEDRKNPAVAGGQTADEGGPAQYPMCSHVVNYGPGETYEQSTCISDTLPDGWVRGDPTPAGNYVCACATMPSHTVSVSTCEDALVAVCHVDLSVPPPCADGDHVCWPIEGERASWRCRCSDDEALSQYREVDTCQDALVEACGIQHICDAGPEQTNELGEIMGVGCPD
jgi:hypothetical protein